MAFVPLFCQSHHSPRGVASPADLVRRARALGYTTLGLCDEATLAGFHAFDEACRAQGIRPVFGCRLMMEGLALAGMAFPLDLLIETEQGYRNLVRLMTVYHRRGEGDRRPLRAEDLHDRVQGLFPILPPDGELLELVRLRERDKAELFLTRAGDLFGRELVYGFSLQSEELVEAAGMTLPLARFVGARAIAAPQVRYPEPGDAAAAVYLDHPYGAPSRSYRPPSDPKSLPALWGEDDLLSRWTDEYEELPHEAGALARRCTWRPGRIRRAYPTLDLERGFDPNSYLFDLVIRGATQRYGEITESLKQRVNRELEDVKANNLAPYLLLNHQIVQFLDEKGISRGVGRSRAVSSVLAYCLGISLIDPLQYKLVAKSLVSEGELFPPICIEVPRSAVPSILQWLRETFGEDHLVEIGRVIDLRRDQMINELANWASMTDEEHRLTHREKARLRSAGAAQRLDELAESTRSRRWRDPAFLGDIAARLAPRPRGWQGAGDRYALSGEPLEWMVPRLRSTQGRVVSGLEEPAIDRLGLARLLFVPHGLLDILDKAMQAAHSQNPGLNFAKIPLDDRPTYELLQRGDVSGIPPLENVTLRVMLRKHAPANLLQLLRVKTESGMVRPGEERPHELSEELPDVLLSYQCAYLKANYPLAFYAAAIDAVIESHQNPSALIRETRRAGFDVLPPDINLSQWDTTIHGHSIRLGLSAIRGFGERAWENVHAVRSGGNFTTLENFCERVNTRIVNLRILRALIASGAMDALDPNRAAMDAVIARLQKRTRERESAADPLHRQATLFELEEWETEPDADEPVADVREWNAWEKLQRESEALGFFLSIDPVARFRIVLEHLAPIPIERINRRHLGKDIRITGLVCAVEERSPLLGREGDRLVDLEGLAVTLPQRIAEVSQSCLEPGTEVFLTGRLNRRDGMLLFDADGIWRLCDMEDQATRVGRVRLGLAEENRRTLGMIAKLVRDYPGNTALELADYPAPRGWTYRRLARRGVFFCSPLYQGLCKILTPNAVELFGQNGEPLLARASDLEDTKDPDEVD